MSVRMWQDGSRSELTTLTVCDGCYSNSSTYIRCGYCGDRYHREVEFQAGPVNRHGEQSELCTYCHEQQVTTCDRCNTIEWRGSIRDCWNPDTGDSYGLCGECYDEEFTTCHQCGHTVRSERMDEHLPECDRQQAIRRSIDRYSWRPPAIFRPTFDPQGLYVGMELEVERARSSKDRRELAYFFQERANAPFENDPPPEEREPDPARDEPTPALVYCKSDGSISDGFEIVTHPMEPRWALDHFPWEALDWLAKEGARSYDTSTCGIHIHVSRAAFTKGHLWRFLQFHYRNPDEHKVVGQRNSRWGKWDNVTGERRNTTMYVTGGRHILGLECPWCSWSVRSATYETSYTERDEDGVERRDQYGYRLRTPVTIGEGDLCPACCPDGVITDGNRRTARRNGYTDVEQPFTLQSRRINMGERAQNTDRYCAVNLRPSNTIELRYFRGNLNTRSVKKNIEHVLGVYSYTKDLKVKDMHDGGLDWTSYRDWLLERRDEYPNLARFIEGKKPL